MTAPDERRWHYRVEYPERAMPVVDTRDGPARMLDVSEAGLRYELPIGAPPPEADEEFTAVLRFHDARKVEVRVVITRVSGRRVSARIAAPGIPLNVMFAEQRWLMRHYPLRFRAAG